MSDASPPTSVPPRASPPSRLPALVSILLVLMGMLVAPYLAENIEFALTRGRLRARSEFAGQELSKLAKTAELVKLSDTSRAFRLVAERIEPCVVHINTEQTVRGEGESPFDEFFGIQRGGYRAVGQGSGVIIDGKNGYVITNYHVIQGASVIEVRLSDNRIIGDGDVRVVGSDVLTDLAVLKIPAAGLIAGELGDSSKLEVGDWVLAIGNPYGLDRTVTCGIVSAKQRRAFAENSAYQNFLQTDAAVNPGNSGGPLVDISGQVIGITTAIVGKAYQGISFAIPSEVVRDVYQHLISQGSVPRGYLGVGLKELTPDIARQLKLKNTEGVLVTGVQPGSPAEKAGIQPGDVVIEWNGQKVVEPSELRLLVAGTKIGSTVPVQVLREGQTQTLQVTVTERRDAG